jgi:maleylpyruvate isomerase
MRTVPAGAGYLPSAVPHDLLAGVCAAHRRLLALVGGVDDATVARPSLLPGWTVAQVLDHLATHAQAQAELFEITESGGPVPERDGRGPAMGSVATRPVREIHTALATAVTRLERGWDATGVDVWRTGFGPSSPGPWMGSVAEQPVSLADLVFQRFREVEIHGVDLGLVDQGGPGWGDLSATYVDAEWAWTTARLPARLPLGVSVLLAPGDRPSRAFGVGPRPVVIRSSTVETLRWALGRLPGAAAPHEWPALTPWE